MSQTNSGGSLSRELIVKDLRTEASNFEWEVAMLNSISTAGSKGRQRGGAIIVTRSSVETLAEVKQSSEETI